MGYATSSEIDAVVATKKVDVQLAISLFAKGSQCAVLCRRNFLIQYLFWALSRSYQAESERQLSP
jgi:hypothetical protein